MLALGLILVVLATLTLLAALFGGSEERIEFDLGPIGLDTTPMAIFLLGAATVLVFVVGLELIRSGVRRARRRRKDTKRLNRLTENQKDGDGRGDEGRSGTAHDTAPVAGTTPDNGPDPRPAPGHSGTL